MSTRVRQTSDRWGQISMLLTMRPGPCLSSDGICASSWYRDSKSEPLSKQSAGTLDPFPANCRAPKRRRYRFRRSQACRRWHAALVIKQI